MDQYYVHKKSKFNVLKVLCWGICLVGAGLYVVVVNLDAMRALPYLDMKNRGLFYASGAFLILPALIFYFFTAPGFGKLPEDCFKRKVETDDALMKLVFDAYDVFGMVFISSMISLACASYYFLANLREAGMVGLVVAKLFFIFLVSVYIVLFFFCDERKKWERPKTN
tara:strand:- start:1615 stop:2118 length:504 start_codon:yes stop_codon:yes gene_type:complete